MQDLLVSINRNVIRLSTVDKDNLLRTTLVDVSKDVVDDTRVVDPGKLSASLNDLLPHISSLTKSRLSLNFVLEPQDVYIRFVTVPKKDTDLDARILVELRDKAKDIPIDDLYFSYKKIAPFVYQFIGVEKEILEKYIEVSNSLGIGLKSVVPWVLLLPKYEKVNEPAIFISMLGNRQTVALSELGGIFFAETYEKERKEEEIQALIKDLSFYKRSSPISRVFTLNCDYLTLMDYEIKEVKMPEFHDESEVTTGYEQNVLVNYFLDAEPEFLNSQLNALNFLPMPVVENKNFSLVAAGSFVAILLLLGGLFGGYLYLKDKNNIAKNNLAQDTTSNQVLSGSTKETTPSESEPQTKSNLKRSDLTIRLENAASISGLAARTKEFLGKLGYNVVSIDTADTDVENTVFRFKKGKSIYTDLLKGDMEVSFPGISVKEDLSDSAECDLLITLGRSSKL